MAKKKANQGRRVVSPLADSSQDYSGPSSADMKSELDFYGKKRAQLVDISSEMESIFSLQQNQRREIDQMYGIEKKMLDNLGFMANQVKIVALQKQATRDLSLEEANILKTTISDYETYNQEAAGVAKKSKELLDFRKKTVPFEDKIRGIQAEIGAMQVTGIQNLNLQEKQRLASLKTMEKGYQALSKQEQMNERIEKIQGSITDLMENQGGAASQIFSTLKDIVTNPLTLFTGLLAVGLSRFETMRQRGNELAEEMDRVNKKLAGAGPFQDKILQKADLIKKRFYEMGEGFSSSLEGSVDAIVALESQFGKIDYVSGKLVKTMAELKLSIGLSDEESAKVLDNFSIVGGMTDEAAVNMTKMTYQMSEQAGLNPQVIFQDIASASGDTLASFSGSADELAKSAVTARRLGLTLDDMTKVSSALLDFETSIEKEMEAQLITGLDLNFQKARMLAMQGDEAGAMEEVMKQVGGLDKFNKMAPHQQRALAEAVGLTVGQLQKSTAQRQREAKQAQMKQDLVQKQYDLAEKALPMLGKLDVGLGVMERIAKVIGDLFLDVFGTGLKDLEKTFFKFLESPAFKTGFKNLLYTIKGIIIGIKDAVMGTAAFIDKLSGGAIGGFLKSFASKDFSGSYGKAEGVGKTIGKGIAVLLGAKMLLGATPLTPMFVSMSGSGMSSMFGGLKKMFSGPLTKGGLPDKRFAANKYGGGVMQNIGSKMFGGATGPAGMTGMSTSAGAALGGFAVGGAIVGKSIYDVATLKRNATGKETGAANSKMVGAGLGAAIGTAILPGIGTAVGAGLGYLGGYLVAETSIFDDKLDTARKGLVTQQAKYDKLQQREQDKLRMAEQKHHNIINQSFQELAGGTDDLSSKGVQKFKEKMIDAGYVTEKQWKTAVANGASTQDLLNIATGSATGKLQDFATETQNNIEKLKQQQGYYKTQADIDHKKLQAESVSMDIITKDEIKEAVAEHGAISKYNVFSASYGDQSDATDKGKSIQYVALVKDLIKEQTGITSITSKQIEEAIKVAADNQSFYSSAETKTADVIEDILGSLEHTLETQYTKDQEKNQILETSIADQQFTNRNLDDAIVPGKAGGKVVNVHDVSTKAAGGILADGGITYGPSHAEGGIPTRYGELEGGEAVINKRSTAMFKDQLSQLNQAGGGVAFGDGGVTSKFEAGGTIGPFGTPLENVATKPAGEIFPLSTRNTKGGDRISYMMDTRRDDSINKMVDSGKYGFNFDSESLRGLLNPQQGMSKADMKMRDRGPIVPIVEEMKKGGMSKKEIQAYIRNRSLGGLVEENNTMSPAMHLALDLLGLLPIVGGVFDLANAAAYTREGNYAHAALSAAAAIPGAGYLAAATKLGIKGTKTAKVLSNGFHTVEALNIGNEARKLIFENPDNPGHGFAIEGDPGFDVPRGGKVSDKAKMNMGLDKKMLDSAEIMGERGGITAKSPITKVNDMILTKDGQMIETHEDDNLIAKKGGITQKPASGGKSRVEELLEQLIMVTGQKGDVYMDGAKVSAAVNQANYNA